MTTYVYRKKRKYPPGPLGIPLIGFLPSVTINPTQFHSYLARRYGPITYYQYGTHVLNSEEDFYALKSEKLNLDEFIGKEVKVSGSKIEGYPVDGGPDYILVTEVNEQ